MISMSVCLSVFLQSYLWNSGYNFLCIFCTLLCAHLDSHTRTRAHIHTFNGPLSRTTRVSRYQKGKTNLDPTEPRDSEWQWHQLGHMQICTSLQTDNHASTPPLSFLHARCPSCRPTNSIKALKAYVKALKAHLDSVGHYYDATFIFNI